MSPGRTGVVVLDFGRPDDAARAAASARSADTRVLIVENGVGEGIPSDEQHLRFPENRGFAGGMNGGMKQLLAEGCDRLLLLNSDAVLEPNCLGLLADAIADPALAAVGPVILRESDGRVESRGVSVDLRWGRVRLEAHGETPRDEEGVVPVAALSGAVLMLHRRALERVGLLDEAYFFSFEDIDWCVRAGQAGLGLGVVLGARARHAGSKTIGPGSSDRFYYSARNHVRFLSRHRHSARIPPWLRFGAAGVLELAHALSQSYTDRWQATRAVLAGLEDARRGRFGPRFRGSPPATTAFGSGQGAETGSHRSHNGRGSV
jgi:GT2 family glycosyltransferase